MVRLHQLSEACLVTLVLRLVVLSHPVETSAETRIGRFVATNFPKARCLHQWDLTTPTTLES